MIALEKVVKKDPETGLVEPFCKGPGDEEHSPEEEIHELGLPVPSGLADEIYLETRARPCLKLSL